MFGCRAWLLPHSVPPGWRRYESLQGGSGLGGKAFLHGAGAAVVETDKQVSRAGEGQDVEPDLIRRAVPLNQEALFARLDVAGKCTVGEAEAGCGVGVFVYRVDDPRRIRLPQADRAAMMRTVSPGRRGVSSGKASSQPKWNCCHRSSDCPGFLEHGRSLAELDARMINHVAHRHWNIAGRRADGRVRELQFGLRKRVRRSASSEGLRNEGMRGLCELPCGGPKSILSIGTRVAASY